MTWDIDGPQGFESRKIKYLLPRYTRGRGLEIGCGMEKAYPHFIGIDNGHHFGHGAADIMAEADDLSLFSDNSLDFVFSSHVLEHMPDMQAALDEWARVIKVGGCLCLYVPSANLYPKCGEPGANPDHKHDIYPGDIAKILGSNGAWQKVECEERSEGIEYSLFEVYQKLEPGLDMVTELAEDRKKTACVCRFGGFGDMLQSALIFPRLKEQGYHVTVMTTPKGQNVLCNDPHVDDWYIVDQDQIPNNELVAFWAEQERRFDRFINLSESIEGYLLAIPGRPNHAWPFEVRKKRMNLNYHEWTCQLAGVELKPTVLFHASRAEQFFVEEQLDENQFNLVWALAGSSIHKFTPHQDTVIARIMLEMPEAQVFLVGDDKCQVLEQGWEEEERVVCLSGKLTIRESLALAQNVDLVIGPETGVLNAVGMENTPHKVLMLSHSSKNNLSKHWINTQTLKPEDCSCYPCHRLHYSDEFCNIDEMSGAARCAVNISADTIYTAVKKVYLNWKRCSNGI